MKSLQSRLFGAGVAGGWRLNAVALSAILSASISVAQDATNAQPTADPPAAMSDSSAQAPAEGPSREWLVIESGPGSHTAVEAASVEEPVPNVVMVTDTAGKKITTNKGKIKMKLPSAPDTAEGLDLPKVTAAIEQFDKAIVAMPGVAEALKPGRDAWEARKGELTEMEQKKAEIKAKVDAFVGEPIEETKTYSASEVEEKIKAGEALIADAPDRQADITAQIEKWRAKLAPPPAPAMAEKPEEPKKPAIAPESLTLPDDYKLNIPESALKPNVVMATIIAVVMSIMFFFYATMHGLGRLLRLKASAFFYLAIGLGGLGFYYSVWLLLLKVPDDFTALKSASKGDAALVESIVAFAQKYPQIEGDASAFKEVALQDGSINEFIKKRVVFVPGKPAPPLDVKRISIWLDVREEGVLVYQELTMLGMPLMATMFVPVRLGDGEARPGAPQGRLGQVTMPKALASVFWREIQEGIGQSLDEAKITKTFALSKVTEHIIHLELRTP